MADFKDIIMFSIKACSIIEQTVFIEQNQCQQTKKIKYFRAISLKKKRVIAQ